MRGKDFVSIWRLLGSVSIVCLPLLLTDCTSTRSAVDPVVQKRVDKLEAEIRIEQTRPVDSLQSINNLNELAVLYDQIGNRQRALQLAMQQIALEQRILDGSKEKLIDRLSLIASEHFKQKNCAAGNFALSKKVDTERALYGTASDQVIRTNMRLGKENSDATLKDRADPRLYYEEALRLARTRADGRHLEADALVALGSLDSSNPWRLSQAESEYKQALSIYKVSTARDPSAEAAAYLYLAQLYSEKKRQFDAAEVCLRKALSIYDNVRPQNAVSVMLLIDSMASGYRDQAKSAEIYKLAVRFGRKYLSERDPEVVYAKSRLLDCYKQLGSKGAAEDLEAELKEVENPDPLARSQRANRRPSEQTAK